MNAIKSLTIAATFGVLACGSYPSNAAENPFMHFAGSWSGTGQIVVQNGSRERIRCRAQYKAGETNALSLSLRCASDSYKFELQSDVTSNGGSISGSWNEQTRQIYGQLTGRMTPTHIEATAQTVGFNATISISTRGNSQSVMIRSPGSEISEVSISLARSGR